MKRTPLSLIRLYKMANNYTQDLYYATVKEKKGIAKEYKVIVGFLKYINDHKNDEL